MSFQLAFPDDDHPPAQAAEAADVPAVVGHVPREFFGPVLLVALGGGHMGAVGGLWFMVGRPSTMKQQRLNSKGVNEYHGHNAKGNTEDTLFDIVVLPKIMGTAKKLDIFGSVGSATFREGDDMVEMEVHSGTTFSAFATIAFPYFQFNAGGNDSTMGGFLWNGNLEVFFTFDGDQLKFEDFPAMGSRSP